MIAYLALLVLIAVQRLDELRRSRHNAAWALARGGVEFGQRQLPVMAWLHSTLLIGSAVEVVVLDRPFVPAIGFPMLLVVVAGQCVRLWTMRVLGPYWNARIIVVPGMVPATSGPYRWLRHPNYLAVILEGIAIPMIHGAWITAIAFSIANGPLMRARIRREEQALSFVTDYTEALGDRGSLWPTWRPSRRPAVVALREVNPTRTPDRSGT